MLQQRTQQSLLFFLNHACQEQGVLPVIVGIQRLHFSINEKYSKVRVVVWETKVLFHMTFFPQQLNKSLLQYIKEPRIYENIRPNSETFPWRCVALFIKLFFGKKQLLKLSVLLFSCTVINYLLFGSSISFLLYLLCTLCCSVFK